VSGLPVALAPATALRNLIHLRQAELLRGTAEVEELSASVDRVAAQLLGGVPGAADGQVATGIEVVRGRRAIAERVQALMASAGSELALLDRPPYAASAPDGMPAPLAVSDLVRRGVGVRVVVDRAGLDFPGRARGLNELAADGVRIRIASGLPTKLITADRRITLLPPTDAADPTASALVVSDVLLRNALVPLFEALWDQAMPIGPSPGDQEPAADGISVEDRELLTLLASGLKDEAIARRLDVHVHTVRRRIRRLLTVLDAETRFQAGVQALRRGWLVN
jgi:DNA-binding CsgD family transcriptional regulator